MAKLSTLLVLASLPLLAVTISAAQTFAPVATYSVGYSYSYPVGIAAGDVNGDGKNDLLTANFNNSTVGIFLGTGTGAFQTVLVQQLFSNPSGIAVADVNNDGKLDVLTTGSTNNSVTVQLGNGNGTIAPAISYFTGISSNPQGLTLADMNGDGKLDLLTANSGASTAGVLLGNGNGTFQGMTAYFTGTNSRPTAIAAVDVNNDGKPDLLTANGSNSTVAVLLGTGTGMFQAAVTYSAGSGSYPTGVAVADVNGDGKPDILTANYYNDTVGVLLGTGIGTFQPVTTYPTSPNSGPASIVVADINGDSRLDLLTANGNNSTAGVLLGNGNGTFQTATAYPTGSGSGPSSIVAADVNGDGKLDLCTVNANAATIGVLLNTTPLATRAALPGASATLFPNPASTAATLTLAGLPAPVAQVQATLHDATGRAVAQHTLAAAQGSTRAELPCAALAAGLYVLRLEALDAQGQPAGSLPAQRLSIQ